MSEIEQKLKNHNLNYCFDELENCIVINQEFWNLNYVCVACPFCNRKKIRNNESDTVMHLFQNTVNQDNKYMICDNSKCDFDTKFNTEYDYKFKVLLKKPEIIFD